MRIVKYQDRPEGEWYSVNILIPASHISEGTVGKFINSYGYHSVQLEDDSGNSEVISKGEQRFKPLLTIELKCEKCGHSKEYTLNG